MFSIAVFQTMALVPANKERLQSFPVLNVVVETETHVLSLVRYIPDLIEFDHLIKSHYHKVKIPFPALTDPAEKRRSLRHFLGSLSSHGRPRSDAEKVERYLQRCAADPVVCSSTLFRDFFSPQRDEDKQVSKTHDMKPAPAAHSSSLTASPPLSPSLPPPPATPAPPPPSVPPSSMQSRSIPQQTDNDVLEKDVNDQSPQKSSGSYPGTDSRVLPSLPSPPPEQPRSLSPVDHESVSSGNDSPIEIHDDDDDDDEYDVNDTDDDGRREDSEMQDETALLERLEMLKVLGRGCMGKVFLVRSRSTNQLYALKSILKELVVEQREITHTLAERDILATLSSINHPFLAKLHASFQDMHRLYLVTDYYCGGDLATQMSTCTTFSKERTLFYAAEIIEGMGELHRHGILYRDLKPENILLTMDGHVVLTDFGLSKWLPSTDTKTQTFCGTAEYLAPEALLGEPYDVAIDYWAYGTILYEMLAGITPFWADNHSEMYRRVLQDPLEFPADTDFETAEFLSGLLDRDPSTRLGVRGGVDEIKSHMYFADIDWDQVYARQLIPPYVPDLQSDMDLSNFDPSFLEMQPTLTPVSSQTDLLTPDLQEVFEGYAFSDANFMAAHAPPPPSPPPPPPKKVAKKKARRTEEVRRTMDRIDEQQRQELQLLCEQQPLPPSDNADWIANGNATARKRNSVSMLSDVDSFHLDDASKRRNTSFHDVYEQQQNEARVVAEQQSPYPPQNTPPQPQHPPELSLSSTAADELDDLCDFGADVDLNLAFDLPSIPPPAAKSSHSSRRKAARRFFSPLLRF